MDAKSKLVRNANRKERVAAALEKCEARIADATGAEKKALKAKAAVLANEVELCAAVAEVDRLSGGVTVSPPTGSMAAEGQ